VWGEVSDKQDSFSISIPTPIQVQESWAIISKDLDTHGVKFILKIFEIDPPALQLYSFKGIHDIIHIQHKMYICVCIYAHTCIHIHINKQTSKSSTISLSLAFLLAHSFSVSYRSLCMSLHNPPPSSLPPPRSLALPLSLSLARTYTGSASLALRFSLDRALFESLFLYPFWLLSFDCSLFIALFLITLSLSLFLINKKRPLYRSLFKRNAIECENLRARETESVKRLYRVAKKHMMPEVAGFFPPKSH